MKNPEKAKKGLFPGSNFVLQLQFFRPNLGHSHDSLIFQRTRLGQLHSTLPMVELAALLPEPENSTGAKPWFDNYGKVALQFL